MPPLSEDVAARIEELGLDFERSGLKYLPNETRVRSTLLHVLPLSLASFCPLPYFAQHRIAKGQNLACRKTLVLFLLSGFIHCPLPRPQMRAMDRKAVKFEKTKNEKCGSHMWEDVSELAQLIR